MNCHICGAETQTIFTATLLKKYEAPYHYCAGCDHVFVDHPTWLDEAYSDAILHQDTDVAVRNILTALRLAAINYLALGDRGQAKYVDVAGGYGLLARLMRDLGFDYYWSDRYAKNLFAKGFDYDPRHGACLAISAIEVLEHTLNPFEFIQHNLATYRAGILIFTTETFPDNHPPGPTQWGYYSLDTGQHIAFFSRQGLTRLAHRLDMHYYPLGRLHVFSKKPLSSWRLKLASHKLLVVPVALFAALRLGSKRGSDQVAIRKRAAQREA
ncbi:MAG: class I SAM-dependent methyltransferase [Thiobacillus sp.]|nr:class I SAM-dependent methyltransferase [Thiobacillus sp.]